MRSFRFFVCLWLVLHIAGVHPLKMIVDAVNQVGNAVGRLEGKGREPEQDFGVYAAIAERND
jgi:hypothetical protein